MAIRRWLSKTSAASRSAGADRRVIALLAMALSVWAGSLPAQTAPAQIQSPDEGSSSSSWSGSSPGQVVQHKTGTNSAETVRHTRVPEEGSAPPELAQAEDLIQSQHYDAAEPLLKKAVAAAPASYVAWFDLGFVENQLGKTDDSIAAYRKSVAAKPDVFESNLNLGLQLAKTGQADAELYLRAATHLTPTSHPDEGQYRAWLSLAQTMEKSKPEDALAAYQRAATLQPDEAEPHLSAGQLLEQENKFADAEQQYKQALA